MVFISRRNIRAWIANGRSLDEKHSAVGTFREPLAICPAKEVPHRRHYINRVSVPIPSLRNFLSGRKTSFSSLSNSNFLTLPTLLYFKNFYFWFFIQHFAYFVSNIGNLFSNNYFLQNRKVDDWKVDARSAMLFQQSFWTKL